jgi:hypothetical protein
MAEQYLILTSDAGNTGKKLRIFENTISSVVVESQAQTLVDSSGNIIAALTAGADATANATIAMAMAAMGYVFNGASWDRARTPNVFKVVALGAGTSEATIWTPTSSKKFRLTGFVLTVGAASTMTFKDNTAGTTIFAARGAQDQPVRVDLGNGILSAAANNVLTVTRGTSATLDGVVWGNEE